MPAKPRVCAIDYLNTLPLVWGFLHGDQQGQFDVSFRLPSECADLLRSGQADIGIPPSIELATQSDLVVIPGCSISSRGEVGSILLISHKPIEELETIAGDTSSRTSIALAQVVLARRYHRFVKIRPYPPRVNEMLEIADAALVIGDPALRFERPADQSLWVYDLGAEWSQLTRLPMVYAVWAVRRPVADPSFAAAFQASAQYGQARIAEIVAQEAPRRGISLERARKYLTSQVHHEWGEAEKRGLSLFLEYAAELGLVPRRASLDLLDEPALTV